jgi:CelD/BcsL family acetyltransferase involved in cellulose biosynthesis
VSATGSAVVVARRDLDAEDLDRWSRLQQADAALASPFFRPEYAALIDEARAAAGAAGGVEVLRLGHAGTDTVGFWPFERDGAEGRARGRGVPVGRHLTDSQGLVAAHDVEIDTVAALRAAGLERWTFDHLPLGPPSPTGAGEPSATPGGPSDGAASPQPALARWATPTTPSPVIELDDGFEAWAAATHAARAEQRKGRRMAKELGPLRFEVRTTDAEVLRRLLAWKSGQYLATGVTDITEVGWCRSTFELAAALDEPLLQGIMSALWAGDDLVAAHLGLRSGPVWHWWLPAYDPAAARHSPGTVLLLAMADAAPGLGVRMIDLGKGDEPYKARLATGAVPLGRGAVVVPSLRGRARAVRTKLRRTSSS